MTFSEKNCNTCGQKCAIKYHGCSNWIPMQSGWIPVGERLPEKPTGQDWYWSSNQRKDIAADEYIVMIEGAKSPTTLHWTGEEWMDIYDNEIYKIVAWMPLPKPYEPTCDTCQYTTAAFNPCNACKDKSEYKPQESEEV